MLASLFAIDLSEAAVARFLMNLLAVGGGFLAGFLLVMLLGSAFDRWVMGRKSADVLHRAARIMGGLLVAFIVAFLVFGSGSGGNGGKGGGGADGDKQPAAVGGTGGSTTVTTDAGPKPPVIPKDLPPPTQVLKVTILGGEDVQNQRFYLFDQDTNPLVFEELRERILMHKQMSVKTLGLEIRFSGTNRLARDHVAVRRLEKWAQEEARISVTFPGSP